MLALLRVNPDAFIAGNINLLRRGAILRAPQPAELSRYDAAEAAAMVHEQIRNWREGRPVPPQPAALPPEVASGTDATHTAEAPRMAAARLEIRSEEHTSELQSLMRISYAVFCLKKKKQHNVSTT